MYNQGIFLQIRREGKSRGSLKKQFFSAVFPDPGGKLHRSDIAALPVMGAALRNQNRVPVLQLSQSPHALQLFLQNAFIAGHQDREGSQVNIFRHDG